MAVQPNELPALPDPPPAAGTIDGAQDIDDSSTLHNHRIADLNLVSRDFHQLNIAPNRDCSGEKIEKTPDSTPTSTNCQTL